MNQIHDDPTCPCHEFSARTPLEASSSTEIPREPENVKTAPDPVYGAGIGIPVTKTAFGHHLDSCGVCASVAEQFPDLELFDHQLCPEGRQLFRNPSQSAIIIPTFEQEWQDAPRWTTRYTERQVAEWWFIRGQHAKEVELLTTIELRFKRDGAGGAGEGEQMRTLIEFKDGRSEVYEDAGPNIYDGILSLVGPDCEVVMDDTPLSEINRVVFVNEGEFHE